MAHSSHSERSIHEMLKDTPPMNESNSAIQSGIEGRIKQSNNLPFRNNSGKKENSFLFVYLFHLSHMVRRVLRVCRNDVIFEKDCGVLFLIEKCK